MSNNKYLYRAKNVKWGKCCVLCALCSASAVQSLCISTLVYIIYINLNIYTHRAVYKHKLVNLQHFSIHNGMNEKDMKEKSWCWHFNYVCGKLSSSFVVSVSVTFVLYAFEFSCIHPLHRWFSLCVQHTHNLTLFISFYFY